MFQNFVKLDLPKRRERRFVIPAAEPFLDMLKNHVELVQFSDKPYVETLYFNNDEHEVGFGKSIKARRYLGELSDEMILDPNASYFLEFKEGIGEFKKKFRSAQRTLAEICEEVNARTVTHNPLREYIAITYHRQHYRLHDNRGIRLTLDTDIRYYYFPSRDGAGILIGSDEFPRVEIKEKRPNLPGVNLLEDVLSQHKAFPVISKRFMAYTHLIAHRRRIRPLPKRVNEFPGIEYEAKLSAKSERAFFLMKDMFRNEQGGFSLMKQFSSTLETAGIHQYYRRNDMTVFKTILRGGRAQRMEKPTKEVLISDTLRPACCILKRIEVEKSSTTLWSQELEQATFIGEIRKHKRTFFLENVRSGRMYAVTFDICLRGKQKMYQIEIEYYGKPEGRVSEAPDESAIIADLTALSSLILSSCLDVEPTLLTKEEWLSDS